jgi:hypothetical protein
MFSRFEKELGNFDITMLMLKPARTICERHTEYMTGVLAEIYFCQASLDAEINQHRRCLENNLKHFDLRMKAERQKAQLGPAAGLAYSELALGRVLNGQFEQAIKDSVESKSIHRQRSLFSTGTYVLYWSTIHQVFGLSALGRYAEASEELSNLIDCGEQGEKVHAAKFIGTFRYGSFSES